MMIWKLTPEKFLQTILIGAAMGLSFLAGSLTHEHYRGSVRIVHSIDLGDALNHGQPWLEIEFPSGVTVRRIKLPPDGEWWPDDRLRWVEVLPDGRKKVWLDRLSFEAE